MKTGNDGDTYVDGVTPTPGDGAVDPSSVDVIACADSSQGDSCSYDISSGDTDVSITGICQQGSAQNALVCTAQNDTHDGDASESALEDSCDSLVGLI